RHDPFIAHVQRRRRSCPTRNCCCVAAGLSLAGPVAPWPQGEEHRFDRHLIARPHLVLRAGIQFFDPRLCMTLTPRKQTHRTPTAILFVFLLIIFFPFHAGAHQQTGAGWGFGSGFIHPLTGADHIAAMVAVGLWGAFLGEPAIWLLPVVFPMVMAI